MKKLMERYCNQTGEGSFAVGHTASAMAKNALVYVQTMGDYRVRPPYFTERTNLPSFLLIFTVRGEGRLVTDRGEEALLPGTCAFLNCMEYHRYEPSGTESWDFLWTHFNGNGALGYYQEYIKSGKNVVAPQDSERFSNILREMMRLQKEHSITGELAVNQCFVELLTDLLIYSGYRNQTGEAWPVYIETAVSIIDRDYSQPLTLDILAEKANISKYHLSREFKRWVGMNVTDYLLQVRLNRAKELLSFTEETVNGVAQSCGFNDTSHFIRVFKAHEEGHTPLSYRKQWK